MVGATNPVLGHEQAHRSVPGRPEQHPVAVSDAEHGLRAARFRTSQPLEAATRSRNRPVRNLRILGERATTRLKQR